ncbi:MAG: hypothetical protein ACYS6I_00125 [Planctomycetota bacterium]
MKFPWPHIIVIAVATAGVVCLLICFSVVRMRKQPHRMPLRRISDVPRHYWTMLAEKKIFFGHQSVGFNIVDGLKDVMKEHDYITLNIVETNDSADFDQPIFAHARVGHNVDTTSKINAFRDIMDNGVGNKADIAFFKFCYVDVMRDSEPKQIFNQYAGAMNELSRRYSRTTFLHVTVPVRSVSRSAKKIAKSLIKKLIGRPGVFEDNVKRWEYNALLNDAYGKQQEFFDLALTETVSLNGFRAYMKKGDQKVFIMLPQYTTDGGHLNEEGRKIVAEQLLIILAELANELTA